MAETGKRDISRIPGEGVNAVGIVGDGVPLTASTQKPTGSGRVLPFSFVPTWTGTEAELKAQIASNPGALVDDAPRFQAYVTQCIRLGWPLDVNGVIYCASQMSFVAVGPRLDIKNIGHAVLVGGPTITGRLLKIINTSGATARATDGSLFGINFDIEKMPTGALNSANALEVTGFRRFDIDCCNFYSGDNYQTAGGDSHIFFTNGGGRITRCNFTGAVDLGIYVSGTYNGLQDKEGLLIQGNTFKNCANAWSMKRNFQNWRSIGNWYKGCRNGAGLPGDMTDATGEGLKTGSLGIISGDIHQNCVASCLDFRDTHGVKADIVVSGTFGVDKDGNQTTSACAVKLDNADGCDITFLYEATSTDSGHAAVRIQNGSVDNRVRGVVMGTIANGLLETNGENNTVDLKLGAAVTAPGTIVGANTQFSYDQQGTREFLIGPYSRLAGRRPFGGIKTANFTVSLNAVGRTLQIQPAAAAVKAILPNGAVNGDMINFYRHPSSGAGLVQVRNPGDTANVLVLTDPGQYGTVAFDGTAWIFVARSVSDLGIVTGDVPATLKTSGNHTLTAFDEIVPTAQYLASNSAVRAVPGLSRLKRDGEGTLFATIGAENLYVSGLSIDMDFTASGASGHAMSFGDCSDITLREIRISDVGNLGGTAGSGLLAYTSGVGSADATSYAYRIKFLDSAITADLSLSDDTHGAIIEDGRYCRIDGLWTDGFRGFGQEFKHDTRYSLLINGISGNCGYAFGYGQSEAGSDGADLNVSANLISYASDQGHTIGEGRYNLTSNLLVDADGAPGVFGGGAYGAHAQVGAVGNAWMNLLTHGAMTYPVRSRGDSNTFEVISHDTAAKIASFDAGVMRNVVRVVHPGARDSISNAVTDNSGNLPGGSSGNVVYSPATGEHFGTFSGWFWNRINPYGGSFNSTQKLRWENNDSLVMALAVPGAPGQLAGIAINSAATPDYAHIQYGFSASPTGEYWEFKIANATKWRMYSSTLRPSSDNDVDMGSATNRVKATYAIRRYYTATVFDAYGTGSPEGVLTGGIGCTYRREDGGPGSTFYVKESGTGNTGWVAK